MLLSCAITKAEKMGDKFLVFQEHLVGPQGQWIWRAQVGATVQTCVGSNGLRHLPPSLTGGIGTATKGNREGH